MTSRRKSCWVYGIIFVHRCTMHCAHPRKRDVHWILASRISMGEEWNSEFEWGCIHPVTQCRDPPLETPKPSRVCDWFVCLPLGFSSLGSCNTLFLSLSLPSFFKYYYSVSYESSWNEAMKNPRCMVRKFSRSLQVALFSFFLFLSFANDTSLHWLVLW